MNRFFRSSNKGEAGEIREDIISDDKARQKQALTKIIAGMTLGRDMSNVFSDVTQLMGSPAIDIKKLVYLYLVQYAATMPEKSVLVAGSFARDVLHPSPLIRGLAIRTMSSITIERMMEFVIEPLRRCLKDDTDPYVNRCAVVAILKLHNTSRSICESNGFLPLLMDHFSSGNATVVATVAAVVRELHQVRGSDSGLEVTQRVANTLQNALAESNEWGQISILDLLSTYVAPDREEAEIICERVLPWLQHGNSSVVLSTVKIIITYLENWCDASSPGSDAQKEEKLRKYSAKLAPALVSLISSHAMEIRYVVLRNINLIVQKFPDLLSNYLRVFYVKYNDPIYVKMEKLEILGMLASKSNVEQLLGECVEYAQEVDIEFVRKAVRTIGLLALKIDVAAAECVQQLVNLVKTKVNYIVQEAIVVIRDIFRRYPNQYESIISVLCENLETLDEPDAKSAMIWIVGEYADRIENASELLEIFTDNFEEETLSVRMTMLGAVVKLYLKRGADAEGLLQLILKECTESDIPDLRDRAYLYWRLLTTDAEAAAQTILSQRESISTDSSTKYDRQLLSHLLRYIGTLSSVYHKPPMNLFAVNQSTSVRSLLGTLIQYDDEEDEDAAETGGAQASGSATGASNADNSKSSSQKTLDFLDVFADVPSSGNHHAPAPEPKVEEKKPTAPSSFEDLFAGGSQAPPPKPTPAPAASSIDDFLSGPVPSKPTPTMNAAPAAKQVDFFGTSAMDPFGFPTTTTTTTAANTPSIPYVKVLEPASSGGLAIRAHVRTATAADGFAANAVVLELEVANETNPARPAQGVAFQMNRNPLGLVLKENLVISDAIAPGARKAIRVELHHVPSSVAPAAQPAQASVLQFAMKSSAQAGVAYFTVPLSVGALLLASDASSISQDVFSQGWMGTPATNVRNVRVPYNPSVTSETAILTRLREQLNVSFIVERNGLKFYAAPVSGFRRALSSEANLHCYVGIRVDATSGNVESVIKCNDAIVLNVFEFAVQNLTS